MNKTHTTITRLCLPPLAWLLLSASVSAQQTPPPAAVETVSVERKSVSPLIWVPGTVISRQDSRIAAEVTGVLTAVAEVGERVKRGDLLAQINDRVWQLQLRNDEADIERLRANRHYIVRQVARVQRLAKANNTARAELEELEMQRDMLQQEISAAEVQRERTLYDIERARILAPFDGIVAARTHRPGEHISAGEPVVRLVNPAALEVSARAPISVSRYIEPGDITRVKNDIREAAVPLRSIIPVGNAQSRTLEVRLQLPQQHWVIGEAVRVALANGASSMALTVPRDALILRDNLVYVYRITAENTAERIVVTPGDGAGSDIAVMGPLQAGDVVVTRGAERLSDGQPVTVVSDVAQH